MQEPRSMEVEFKANRILKADGCFNDYPARKGVKSIGVRLKLELSDANAEELIIKISEEIGDEEFIKFLEIDFGWKVTK